MIKVVILGAGNVAQHLYAAFQNNETVQIVQCYNRRGILLHPDQEKSTIISSIDQLDVADIYIMAISDNAITAVSEQLLFRDRLVVHTSGSVPITAIDISQRRGVFYPLQTFSENNPVDFSAIPICIEVEDPKDFAIVQELAASLSHSTYPIASEQRNALHIAAVFVNNFTNHLFYIGNNICKEHHIPFEILYPLLVETVKKIYKTSPDQAQTGPAKRNDTITIERHLKTLKDPLQKEVYRTLTKAIQLEYGKKL